MEIDGRTLSHETSEAMRRMAVKRVREGEVTKRGDEELRAVPHEIYLGYERTGRAVRRRFNRARRRGGHRP